MWSRCLSSQPGANSGDKDDEDFPKADQRDLELSPEDGSDEDPVDAVDLSEADTDEKEPVKKDPESSRLLTIMFETPKHDVSGALSKWVNEGNKLDRSDVFFLILSLRKRRYFGKALQLLEWIEENKHFDLEERDYASRLDLIAKVVGLYRAEKYIDDIPASHRGEIVYRTHLANYVAVANVTKAEQVLNKMRDLGFPITLFACNQLLLLYKKVDKKKISDVVTMMEKENVKPSLLTYKLLVDTKGAARDIAGMEEVVQTMKADGVEPDLNFQATLVKHYIFCGHHEKAEAILESIEGDDIKENRFACKILLPLYASLGKSDDVERIWKVCEAGPYASECFSAIEAFGRLGNVEKAEKIFEDMFVTWGSVHSKFYNAMLRLYAHQKLLDKGKELARRMEEAGCRIGISSANSLVKL